MVGRSEALFAPSERGAQPPAAGRPSLLSVHFAVIRAAARPALRLELDLDLLADEVATRVAARLADRIASQACSPWMAMDEAIAYTRIPAGTFRKLVAAGRIPSHGGRRKLFHREEVDVALGHSGQSTLTLVSDRTS